MSIHTECQYSYPCIHSHFCLSQCSFPSSLYWPIKRNCQAFKRQIVFAQFCSQFLHTRFSASYTKSETKQKRRGETRWRRKRAVEEKLKDIQTGPFKHLPNTYQSPSRNFTKNIPNAFHAPSRKPPVNLQTPTIHSQNTPNSEYNNWGHGWVSGWEGGWVVQAA